MIAKVPFTLLCSAVLAYACGPRAHQDSIALDEPTRGTRATKAMPLATTLAVKVDDDVTFDFAVINEGKQKLEVSFADGRTHDLVVLDSLGREVWRWSEGRYFTQNMQNRVMRTSAAMRFAESWDEPAPGKYVAVATLASRNYPAEQRVEFTIPE
jgi:Intracellular proteinase inhibitor